VLITGGSGVVGTRLTELLLQKGYQVVHLGRTTRNGTVHTFGWDPGRGKLDDKALDGVGVIMHLAGASIAGKRWTSRYKKEILSSRVDSTRLLFQSIKKKKTTEIRIFISASAIGYYGLINGHNPLTEADKPGHDFLATVVQEWEAEVDKVSSLGPRVSMIRTGIVLSEAGGALPQMTRPIRLGIGAPLGSGEQIVSWVHIDDLCRAYIFLMENQLSGPLNVTAPQPVSNKVLTKAIAERIGKRLWLPNIPEFVLKVALGEMAEAVLTGNAVSSEKIMSKGFRFAYEEIKGALRSLSF